MIVNIIINIKRILIISNKMERQQWTRATKNLVRDAIRYLDGISLPNNPTIVFDVDDTLLESDGKCIKPVKLLYDYAIMLGIDTVIITCRKAFTDVIQYTKEQLKQCGIINISTFYFRHVDSKNPWTFKAKARKNIFDRGCNVVMSVGDKDWDVCGEFTGQGVKIPLLKSFYIKYSTYLVPIIENLDTSSSLKITYGETY
jgi:hypothetical protein